MAKKRKPAPVPEKDRVQQMYDSLVEVAANAREANASEPQDENVRSGSWLKNRFRTR